MFTKSNLLATFVATVVMFLLGYAIWGVALAEFYATHSLNNVMLENPDLLLIFISNLVVCFIIANLYRMAAGNQHTGKTGFAVGAWLGAFIGVGIGLMWYATAQLLDLTATLVEAVLDVFFYGFIGWVISWVYKKSA